MSNGFSMVLVPNQQVLGLAMEGGAQFGKRVEVDVAGGAGIEAVDEIFRHARNFGQFARRDALAGFGLLPA